MTTPTVVVYRSAVVAAIAWSAVLVLLIGLTILAGVEEWQRVVLAWVAVLTAVATVCTVKTMLSRRASDMLDEIGMLLDARGCAPRRGDDRDQGRNLIAVEG